MAFHETRFPTGIAFGSRGGPRRKTIVASAGSGFEARNSKWADSRREYNAGYGIKSEDDIHTLIEFFEQRRGMLHEFRWKDRFDWKSCAPGGTPAFDDQTIGTGDGTTSTFQLTKTYGTNLEWIYTRDIKKPVSGTVKVGVNGVELLSGWSVDTKTGIITFNSLDWNLVFDTEDYAFGNAPPAGHTVTAGYEFDVPVRFNTDYLEIDFKAFEAGDIPDIPIVEVRL